MERNREFLMRLNVAAVVIIGLMSSSCSWFSEEEKAPETQTYEAPNMTNVNDEDYDVGAFMNRPASSYDGQFESGEGSGLIFGDDKLARGGVIGVNSYLWRASLDTISFLPIKSADAFGGVILTDWHSPAGTPNERFKLNVYILDRALRADGIRVGVFRQVIDRRGQWRDASISKKTARKIEDAILTRARQLRLKTAKK